MENAIENLVPYLFPLAFVLVGLALSVFAIYAYRRQRDFRSRSITTNGTVVDVVWTRIGTSGSRTRVPVVRFTPVIGGDQVTFESSVGSLSPPGKGTAVRVRYDPQEPDKAQVDSSLALWGAPIILGAVGGIFMIGGLAFLLLVIMGVIPLRELFDASN